MENITFAYNHFFPLVSLFLDFRTNIIFDNTYSITKSKERYKEIAINFLIIYIDDTFTNAPEFYLTSSIQPFGASNFPNCIPVTVS